jgi:hypothetical protein
MNRWSSSSRLGYGRARIVFARILISAFLLMVSAPFGLGQIGVPIGRQPLIASHRRS